MFIKNIDINGNEISNIDWDKYIRLRTEEIVENDNVIGITSICELRDDASIERNKKLDALNNLESTDYVIFKFSEQLLSCNSIDDILSAINLFNEHYGNIIEERKNWRKEINKN